MSEITDTKVGKFISMVDAAVGEFDLAVRFHETWRPTFESEDLHREMSFCFAGNAFNIIRLSLRRELMSSLMRLWDTRKDTIRLVEIGRMLSDKQFIELLTSHKIGNRAVFEHDIVIDILNKQVRDVLSLLLLYSQQGERYHVIEKLLRIRNKVLSHRNLDRDLKQLVMPGDDEIEELYQSLSKIMSLLMHIAKSTAYDPQELAGIHKMYAKCFWDGVRNEKTQHLARSQSVTS